MSVQRMHKFINQQNPHVPLQKLGQASTGCRPSIRVALALHRTTRQLCTKKIIGSPMLLPCEIQGARHTTNSCLKLLTSQLQPTKLYYFFPLRGSTVYKTSMIRCSYQTAVLRHCRTFSGNATL